MNTNVEDYVEPVKSKMREKLDKLQDVQNRVTGKAKDMSYATHQYVTENPWKSIGMVALAACLLGWFLRSATSED